VYPQIGCAPFIAHLFHAMSATLSRNSLGTAAMILLYD
jgi:hypothetical protein